MIRGDGVKEVAGRRGGEEGEGGNDELSFRRDREKRRQEVKCTVWRAVHLCFCVAISACRQKAECRKQNAESRMPMTWMTD